MDTSQIDPEFLQETATDSLVPESDLANQADFEGFTYTSTSAISDTS